MDIKNTKESEDSSRERDFWNYSDFCKARNKELEKRFADIKEFLIVCVQKRLKDQGIETIPNPEQDSFWPSMIHMETKYSISICDRGTAIYLPGNGYSYEFTVKEAEEKFIKLVKEAMAKKEITCKQCGGTGHISPLLV